MVCPHLPLEEITRYQQEIETLKNALLTHDGAQLEAAFDLARTARRAWAQTQNT